MLKILSTLILLVSNFAHASLFSLANSDYSIHEVELSSIDSSATQYMQSFVESIVDSGAEGKLFAVRILNDEYKKEIGASAAYVLTGYYFALSKGPGRVSDSARAIYAKDSYLQNLINDYMMSGGSVVLLPNGRGVSGLAIAINSKMQMLTDLVVALFPGRNQPVLGLSVNADVGTFIHEKHHVDEKISSSITNKIISEVKALNLSDIKFNVIQFINEFDAYDFHLRSLRTLKDTSPQQKVWWSETYNGKEQYYYDLLSEYYKNEFADALRSIGLYSGYLHSAFGKIKEQNPESFCQVLFALNKLPQVFFKLSLHVKNYENDLNSCRK